MTSRIKHHAGLFCILSDIHKIFKEGFRKFDMETEKVTIPKSKYDELKRKAEMDEHLLQELVQGLKDIRAGNARISEHDRAGWIGHLTGPGSGPAWPSRSGR